MYVTIHERVIRTCRTKNGRRTQELERAIKPASSGWGTAQVGFSGIRLGIGFPQPSSILPMRPPSITILYCICRTTYRTRRWRCLPPPESWSGNGLSARYSPSCDALTGTWEKPAGASTTCLLRGHRHGDGASNGWRGHGKVVARKTW